MRVAWRAARRYNARMNMTVKISKIGNSAGIVLPKEMLAHLDAKIGEVLTVAKTPTGFELRPADSNFDEQMAIARQVMERRKLALRELAK